MGAGPISANLGELKGTGHDVATGDRKGREGASRLAYTTACVDIPRSLSRCRGVDDGFTPSRPLRSPGPTQRPVPIKFAPMGAGPIRASRLTKDHRKDII